MTVQVPPGGMDWDPQQYREAAPFVPAGGLPVVELLAPGPGQRILDLGCGDGSLTTAIAKAGATVVAVDASPQMVDAARARGLDARVIDGRELPFDGEFDAVFTNAALHWMADLEAVVGGVQRALRPGGRFVGEFAGPGNLAAIGLAVTSAALARGHEPPPNPWRSSSATEWTGLLRDAGLTPTRVEVFARPTPLPGGLAGWLETFGEPLLGHVSEQDRTYLVAEAVRLARPWLADVDGSWSADYVRLRFDARRPGDATS